MRLIPKFSETISRNKTREDVILKRSRAESFYILVQYIYFSTSADVEKEEEQHRESKKEVFNDPRYTEEMEKISDLPVM